ncbi:MAG TPA: glycosyltransferase family A protein, partial [Chroococcales cyanobacterium]
MFRIQIDEQFACQVGSGSTAGSKVTRFLSIVVPVYNGGATFEHCLRAILTSAASDTEVLVVDAGSTDDSATRAERLGVRVIRLQGRRGPAEARNIGAQEARGEYLCFIDADCEVHAKTLALLKARLRKNPEITAAFGSYD